MRRTPRGLAFQIRNRTVPVVPISSIRSALPPPDSVSVASHHLARRVPIVVDCASQFALVDGAGEGDGRPGGGEAEAREGKAEEENVSGERNQ
jgi:hypothetical protein